MHTSLIRQNFEEARASIDAFLTNEENLERVANACYTHCGCIKSGKKGDLMW